jgi:hypothetical protein
MAKTARAAENNPVNLTIGTGIVTNHNAQNIVIIPKI